MYTENNCFSIINTNTENLICRRILSGRNKLTDDNINICKQIFVQNWNTSFKHFENIISYFKKIIVINAHKITNNATTISLFENNDTIYDKLIKDGDYMKQLSHIWRDRSEENKSDNGTIEQNIKEHRMKCKHIDRGWRRIFVYKKQKISKIEYYKQYYNEDKLLKQLRKIDKYIGMREGGCTELNDCDNICAQLKINEGKAGQHFSDKFNELNKQVTELQSELTKKYNEMVNELEQLKTQIKNQ